MAKGYSIHVGINQVSKLIAACQDEREAAAGSQYSLFTYRLLQVWREQKALCNYATFYNAIRVKMPNYQIPNYCTIGIPNCEFENQSPFKISF